MSPICVACRQISTSSVDVPTVPSTRITPYDVNVKTKTIDAAASTAGRSRGSVTSRNARHGDAPSVAAAASRSGGRWSQTAPTVRTTTARLNTTWAARIAGTPRSHRSGSSASTAAPMTIVGSTNADASRPDSSRRPGNVKRAMTYAGARPTVTVMSVLASACHSVNQAMSQVERRPSVSASEDGDRPRASSVRNGQA